MATNHDLFLITGDSHGQSHVSHVKTDDDGVPELKGVNPKVPLDYPGRRKVLRIGQLGTPDAPRGPGFSILPNRPDPDTSQMSCFLINQRNLRDVNPWTVAEWSQSPSEELDAQVDAQVGTLADAPEFRTPDFEVLLAGPQGRLYHVSRNGGAPKIIALAGDLLAKEGELWTQLRNGMVAGTVRIVTLEGGPRTIAAINVTSVLPRQEVSS